MKINIVNHSLYSWSGEMKGYVSFEGNICVTTHNNPLFVYTLLHELVHVFFDCLHLSNQYHYWLDIVNVFTKVMGRDERKSILQNNKQWYLGKN